MEEQQKHKKVVRIPGWLACAIFLFIVVITFTILYLQFARYQLVSKAIDVGDSTTSALLLSPEIATGIAQIL